MSAVKSPPPLPPQAGCEGALPNVPIIQLYLFKQSPSIKQTDGEDDSKTKGIFSITIQIQTFSFSPLSPASPSPFILMWPVSGSQFSISHVLHQVGVFFFFFLTVFGVVLVVQQLGVPAQQSKRARLYNQYREDSRSRPRFGRPNHLFAQRISAKVLTIDVLNTSPRLLSLSLSPDWPVSRL